MKRFWMLGAATAILLSFGCENQKPDLVEDFAGLEDEKSDQFSKKMKLVGSLDYGQTSGDVKFHNPPKYRAFKFAGQKGDQVEIDVTSANGDSFAWLTDNAFNVIKKNDDYGNSLDSHIEATLPGNRNPDIVTYYIIFSEYSGRDATFRVSLKKKPVFCGGFAGLSCPAGMDCVDNPNDSCDPTRGGADCGGICVPHVEEPKFCGGIAAFPCPEGYECVDNPDDSCDPANGGADCGGICVPAVNPCAAVLCVTGTQCVNCFGGPRCLAPGQVCAF